MICQKWILHIVTKALAFVHMKTICQTWFLWYSFEQQRITMWSHCLHKQIVSLKHPPVFHSNKLYIMAYNYLQHYTMQLSKNNGAIIKILCKPSDYPFKTAPKMLGFMVINFLLPKGRHQYLNVIVTRYIWDTPSINHRNQNTSFQNLKVLEAEFLCNCSCLSTVS